jgi:ABC-type transporter Mla subunit MlaD
MLIKFKTKNKMKPQRENILDAIKSLEQAIDTFPDKDDEIRRYNEVLDGMIAMLKILINDIKYE